MTLYPRALGEQLSRKNAHQVQRLFCVFLDCTICRQPPGIAAYNQNQGLSDYQKGSKKRRGLWGWQGGCLSEQHPLREDMAQISLSRGRLIAYIQLETPKSRMIYFYVCVLILPLPTWFLHRVPATKQTKPPWTLPNLTNTLSPVLPLRITECDKF